MPADGRNRHGPAVANESPAEGRLLGFLGCHRTLVQVSTDGLAWTLAICFATLSRYDFHVDWINVRGVFALACVAILVQSLSGLACGLYTGRSRFGSFEEVMSLVKAIVVSGAVLTILNLIPQPRLVPASVPIGAGLVALVLMAGARYCWRLAIERRLRPQGDGCNRLLVFGAGEGASQVIPALLRDPNSSYVPVGLIDDDPTKRKLRIKAFPCSGTVSG